MEPQTPASGNSVETGGKADRITGLSSEKIASSQTPEAGAVEQAPATQETDSANRESVNQNAGMTLPKVVSVSTPVSDDPPARPVAAVASQPDPANPAVADDVDVVEKEWVDRARQIVEQTRSDPHRQEQEVEKLQVDYLKKRYGKEIKAGNEI